MRLGLLMITLCFALGIGAIGARAAPWTGAEGLGPAAELLQIASEVCKPLDDANTISICRPLDEDDDVEEDDDEDDDDDDE